MKLEQIVEAIFSVTEEYREVLALIYTGLASTEHLKQWESVYEPFYSWMESIVRGSTNEWNDPNVFFACGTYIKVGHWSY